MPFTFTSPAINNSTVKMRWLEPYVSAGLNQKMSAVIAPGIYRGYRLSAHGSLALTVVVSPDATSADSVAVYQTSDGFSLTIRNPASAFNLDLSDAALLSQTVVIAIIADYTIGSATTASYIAYTLAEYNALSAAARGELVVLGTVANPASGVIPAANVTHDRRTSAWSAQAPEATEWKQLVKNGGFEYGPLTYTSTTRSLLIPDWVSTAANNCQWRISSTSPNVGARCLTLEVLAAGTYSPLLSQRVGLPVVAGQLIKVQLFARNLIVPTSGTLALRLDFLQSAGGATQVVSGTVTVPVTVSAVDAGYVEVSSVASVPASNSVLASVNLVGTSLIYASTGTAIRIDDIRVWAEASPLTRDEPVKGMVQTSQLMLEGTTSGSGYDDAAAITLNEAFSAISVAIDRRDGDTTSLNQPSLGVASIKNLGKNLLASSAGAILARVSAAIATAAGVRFTLLWESIPSGKKGVRIYGGDLDNITVTEPGLFITVNASFDGSNWNKDINATNSTGMYLTAADPFFRLVEQTTPNSWATSAWLDKAHVESNGVMTLTNLVAGDNTSSVDVSNVLIGARAPAAAALDVSVVPAQRGNIARLGVDDVAGIQNIDMHGILRTVYTLVEYDFDEVSSLGPFALDNITGTGGMTLNGDSLVVITSGSTSNDITLIKTNSNAVWNVAGASYQIGYRARVKITDISAAHQYIGFWDSDAGASPVNGANMTGFKIINGVVSVVWNDSSGLHIQPAGLTVAANDFRWFSFSWTPVSNKLQWHISANGGDLFEGYASGLYGEEAADDIQPSDNMYPMVATQTAAPASSASVTVDYMSAWINKRR